MSIEQMLRVYFVAGSQDCRHLGADAADSLLCVLEKALKAGISCYQFRDKGTGSLEHNPTAQAQLAQACLSLCRQYDVPFIVNDDVNLACELGADGIHVGQDDVSIHQIRQNCPPDILVGLSINTLEQALLWQNEAVDYFGVGPIFATASKADHKPPVGLDFIKQLRQHGITKPIVAIGSVKACHVAALRQNGADGVAVVSAITQADDIDKAVQALSR